ncbi:MAG: hypothetical protein QXQ02_03840 [Halobacteria archaeon]
MTVKGCRGLVDGLYLVTIDGEVCSIWEVFISVRMLDVKALTFVSVGFRVK